MKVVFVSNFFNHHQKPFADAMYALLGEDYHFVETQPITEERLKMGWGKDEKPSYVKQTYKDEESSAECKRLIDDADVVIIGSAPHSLIQTRLATKKLTFICTERLYKTGFSLWKFPVRFYRHYKSLRRHKSLYLLCASAFSAADYAKTLCFKNKAYKWAYFTTLKKYDSIDALISEKRPASILWCARFLALKHPEAAVEVARRLKKDGYSFEMNLIGTGELEDSIREAIKGNDLSDCVHLLGAMSPECVRGHMEKSEIFLFTSDRNEGWGAVLNESMNSACAVVANHAIGSVPFLLEDGKNGMIYRDKDFDDLYGKVKFLLDNEKGRKEMAKAAFETMKNEWNAENAAHRFIALAQMLLDGEKNPFPYSDGVCSPAPILKDNWK